MSESMSWEGWEALSDDKGNAADLATEIGRWKARADQYRENQRTLAASCPPLEQEAACDDAMAIEGKELREAEDKEWELRGEFSERFGFDVDDLSIVEDDE